MSEKTGDFSREATMHDAPHFLSVTDRKLCSCSCLDCHDAKGVCTCPDCWHATDALSGVFRQLMRERRA